MFTTGSKFLVGGAVLATIAAIAYGITQDGALGTIGLISAAIALAFLAGINMYVRDSDVSSMDTTALTQSAAAAPVPGPSVWPIVGALGGVLVVVGLVTYPVVFVFGILALLAAAVEWMVQAWSERASADVVFNDNVRSRIAHPLEFPILAAVGAGILIYSFSRIMLFLSKSSGPAVFAAIAALLLAGGFVDRLPAVAAHRRHRRGLRRRCPRPRHRRRQRRARGRARAASARDDGRARRRRRVRHAGGDRGRRARLADRRRQGQPHRRGDPAATTTRSSPRTSASPATRTRWSSTRSNPTNVLFINESSEDRRLVLDLGTRAEIDEETGDTIPDTEVPAQLCTQLVEEGGSQLLTFSIPTSSAVAEPPYRFVVPGVDGAEVEVLVP